MNSKRKINFSRRPQGNAHTDYFHHGTPGLWLPNPAVRGIPGGPALVNLQAQELKLLFFSAIFSSGAWQWDMPKLSG